MQLVYFDLFYLCMYLLIYLGVWTKLWGMKWSTTTFWGFSPFFMDYNKTIFKINLGFCF